MGAKFNPLIFTGIDFSGMGSGGAYTDAQARDAVGNILLDSSTLDFTYVTNTSITAAIITGSITNTHINATAAIDFSKMAALTASRALVSDVSGVVTASSITASELGFLSGVTSAIQTQLNNKQPTGNYVTGLSGDVSASGPGVASASISDTTVTGKVLTGFVAGSGTVSATDSILQAVQKVVGNANSFYNKITLVSPLSGTTTTYSTLQAALSAVPSATTNAEARQVYTLFVPSGTYDEDITVDINNKKIVMVCQGSVALGTLTGSSWGSGGTPRSFNLTNNGTATVNSIRSGFAIVSINSGTDGLTSHQSYLSKFRISGDLTISSSVGISSEYYLEVEVFGNCDTSGYSGNCNIYTRASRYRGTFGSSAARLQLADRVTFGGLVTVAEYSEIKDCVFSAGMTTTSASADIQPSGMLHTNFSGTFTGPAGSLRLDSTTNHWFVTNGASLAGGATKVYLDALATSTESGILSSTDWSTFNNKANTSEDYRVESFTLTGTDITNKYVTLALSPSSPSKVRMIILGSTGDQKYGTDFSVTGAQVGWNGLTLDGVLSSGDDLLIVYSK